MPQWEYAQLTWIGTAHAHTGYVTFSHQGTKWTEGQQLGQVLRYLGDDGWEMVRVMPVPQTPDPPPSGSSAEAFTLWFKRPRGRAITGRNGPRRAARPCPQRPHARAASARPPHAA
jgi:hypothetical protein